MNLFKLLRFLLVPRRNDDYSHSFWGKIFSSFRAKREISTEHLKSLNKFNL